MVSDRGGKWGFVYKSRQDVYRGSEASGEAQERGRGHRERRQEPRRAQRHGAQGRSEAPPSLMDPYGFTPRVCPICDAPHAACGPSAEPRHVLDVPSREARRPAVADLYVYEVPQRNGTTTMKLTAEEAKARYGDAAKKLGPAKGGEVQPVSRPPHATNASDVTERPELSEDEAEHLVTSKKAPAPRNKARHAAQGDES